MNVLKPLIYFSIFNHPLTYDELFEFSEIPDKKKIKTDIELLIEEGVVNQIDDYLLFENNQEHIQKRRIGNEQATAVMPKAQKRAEFIYKFPFVKSVAISGSLSKGYFDKESDFDFFVITKAKRVWITRSLIALYKRVFLLNSHKEFCVNYFVSTKTLEIEEKNRFTATEIATIIPIHGKKHISDFYKKNEWVKDYFPNINLLQKSHKVRDIKKTKRTYFIEFIIDNYIGDVVNYLLMRLISQRWKHRYKKKNNNPYKSKKEISKNHPDNFQDKVLKKLNKKYKACEELHGIYIPKEYV